MNNSATSKESDSASKLCFHRPLSKLGNCYCLFCGGWKLKKGLEIGVCHMIRAVCMQSWKHGIRQGAENGDDKGLVHFAEFPVRLTMSNNTPGEAIVLNPEKKKIT